MGRKVSRSYSTLPVDAAAAALRAGGVLPAFANWSSEFAESLRDDGVRVVSHNNSMSLAFGVLGHSVWSYRGIKAHILHKLHRLPALTWMTQ